MADWAYTPKHCNIERTDPTTRRTDYVDGSSAVFEESQESKRIWTERYSKSEADTKAMIAFAKTKRLTTSFTRITWDPEDTTPSTAEATVKLLHYPETTDRPGTGPVETVWIMRED